MAQETLTEFMDHKKLFSNFKEHGSNVRQKLKSLQDQHLKSALNFENFFLEKESKMTVKVEFKAFSTLLLLCKQPHLENLTMEFLFISFKL